jgi:hypothetical protein
LPPELAQIHPFIEPAPVSGMAIWYDVEGEYLMDSSYLIWFIHKKLENDPVFISQTKQ